jgi:hypothetical protein
MNRILKFLVTITVLCAPMFAAAGPGYSLATTTVKPLDVPTVIAATDKMMASATGQKFKGRLLLLQHIADGSDPASLSIVSIYKSAAELETYSNLMQDDPARVEYMKTIVPIAQLQMTARLSTMKSWGDISDTDTIWVAHYFTVTDPAAFVAALDEFQKSPVGVKFPGQGHLAAMSLGGISPVTHVISLGYASIAEMEAYNDMVAKDPAWAKFLAAVRPASTHLGADLNRTLKQWGTASMKALTTP